MWKKTLFIFLLIGLAGCVTRPLMQRPPLVDPEFTPYTGEIELGRQVFEELR